MSGQYSGGINSHSCINFLNSREFYKIGLKQTSISNKFKETENEIFFLNEDSTLLDYPSGITQVDRESLNVLKELENVQTREEFEIKFNKYFVTNAFLPRVNLGKQIVAEIILDESIAPEIKNNLFYFLGQYGAETIDLGEKQVLFLNNSEYRYFMSDYYNFCRLEENFCKDFDTKIKLELAQNAIGISPVMKKFESIGDEESFEKPDLDQATLKELTSRIKIKQGISITENHDKIALFAIINAGKAYKGIDYEELNRLGKFNSYATNGEITPMFAKNFEKTYPKAGGFSSWKFYNNTSIYGNVLSTYYPNLNEFFIKYYLTHAIQNEKISSPTNLGLFYPSIEMQESEDNPIDEEDKDITRLRKTLGVTQETLIDDTIDYNIIDPDFAVNEIELEDIIDEPIDVELRISNSGLDHKETTTSIELVITPNDFEFDASQTGEEIFPPKKIDGIPHYFNAKKDTEEKIVPIIFYLLFEKFFTSDVKALVGNSKIVQDNITEYLDVNLEVNPEYNYYIYVRDLNSNEIITTTIKEIKPGMKLKDLVLSQELKNYLSVDLFVNMSARNESIAHPIILALGKIASIFNISMTEIENPEKTNLFTEKEIKSLFWKRKEKFNDFAGKTILSGRNIDATENNESGLKEFNSKVQTFVEQKLKNKAFESDLDLIGEVVFSDELKIYAIPKTAEFEISPTTKNAIVWQKGTKNKSIELMPIFFSPEDFLKHLDNGSVQNPQTSQISKALTVFIRNPEIYDKTTKDLYKTDEVNSAITETIRRTKINTLEGYNYFIANQNGEINSSPDNMVFESLESFLNDPRIREKVKIKMVFDLYSEQDNAFSTTTILSSENNFRIPSQVINQAIKKFVASKYYVLFNYNIRRPVEQQQSIYQSGIMDHSKPGFSLKNFPLFFAGKIGGIEQEKDYGIVLVDSGSTLVLNSPANPEDKIEFNSIATNSKPKSDSYSMIFNYKNHNGEKALSNTELQGSGIFSINPSLNADLKMEFHPTLPVPIAMNVLAPEDYSADVKYLFEGF
ncbi:MAG: hypothetical protein Q7K42_01800, partial [Candidatus Diapherotrites archaeon]|nr:hypothetical protein [Candidatus Diapherotrites archaeon]